jgi:hypothetical protein
VAVHPVESECAAGVSRDFLRFPGKLRKDLTSITYIGGTLFLTEEASILIERLLVEEINREQSSF